MNPSRNDEPLKKLLTEAFPAREPSLQLRERVSSGAYIRKPHRRQALRLVGAMVLAIACGVGLINWNRWVSAEPLRRMQTALEKVETIYSKHHLTEAYDEMMKSTTDTEEYWEDVKTGWMRNVYHEKKPDGTLRVVREQLIRGMEQWIYDYKRNEVTHETLVPGPNWRKPLGFTIPDIYEDMMKTTGGKVSFKDLGLVIKYGRPAHQYSLVQSDPGVIVRYEFFVDPQTALPFYGELYVQMRGEDQWKLHRSMEIIYNTPPPANVFEPNFPETAAWRELDRKDDRER